jgi:TRAP-type C4-dicarboxylate transport system permease small subunit
LHDAGHAEVRDVKSAEKSWLEKVGGPVRSVSGWFERIGLFGMAAMGLTTLIDVIGSKLLQRPLPGSTEIIAVLQMVAIAGGLAFSKIDGRHIRVDVFVNSLPGRGKAILDAFGALLGFGFFAAAGWMMYEHGLSLASGGTKTFLLGIPMAPFAFWIAFCCIPMCLVILVEFLTSLWRMVK